MRMSDVGLSQADLDDMRCNSKTCTEDHGPLFFHAACHPQSPTWASYHRSGFVLVECAECGKEIVRIEVQS